MKIMLRILIVFALGFSNVYFNNGDQDDELPPPLPTETSAPVGRIPASFEVAASGAATYTIPIRVLPGRQGVQPDLALVYNSVGGSGFLGIRWSLSGLSMITRSGSSYAQDGWLNQIEYDPVDHFNLDGQRLVVIEGDYGDNNTEYRTRNDIFARIICHVTQGDEDRGPEYFTVYTKDGLILTYGQNGAEGRTTVLLGRDGVRRAWALSKVEDRMGNYMLFFYLRDANYFPEDRDGDGIASETLGPAEREMTEMTPSIILYTGNSTTGDSPQRWVKFTYEDHSSPRYGYSGGIRLSQTRLLTKIRVGTGTLVGGDNDIGMVRKYELDYHRPPAGAFSEQPYLISVTERDKDNVAKPPTQFEWIAGARGFSARLTTEHGAPLTRGSMGDTDDWRAFNQWIPIDVNNDGYTDLMYPSAEDRGVSTWRILLNGGQGYYAEHRAYFGAEIDTGVESGEPLGEEWGSQTPYPLGWVMDYNQDGYMDLLLGDGSRTWQVLLNRGSNVEPFFERRPFDTGIPVIEPSPDSYFTYTTDQDFIRFKAFYTYLVDVNADGMRDLIWCEIIGSERDAEHMHRLWKYRLHTGEGFGEAYAITHSDRDRIKNPVRPLFLDYDGDGATDLLIYYGRADGNYTRFSFVDGGPPLSYFSTNLPVFHTQMFFDFSGSVYGERIGPVFVMDINGDGLKDVLYVRTVMGVEAIDDGRWYNDFREPRMWINTGKGFIGGRDGLVAFSCPCINYDDYNFYQTTVLDYNLDGRDDLIAANKRYDTPENRGRTWQAIKFDVIEAANISTFDGSECGFDLAAVIYPPDPVVTGYNNYNTPTIMDVNGDFLPDMVGIEDDRFFVSVMTGETPYVITKIRDGMVGVTEEHPDWDETWTVSVEYEPTTDAEVYQDEYPAELPDGVTVPELAEGTLRNRPAMNIVSSYALDNDIGQAPFAYRLAYHDSRYDRYWGWLGFGQLQVIEELTGIRTTTAFDNFTKEDRLMVRHCPFGYYPYQGMVAHSWTEAALENGSRYLTVRHNSYAHRELGRKRYFAYLKASEARADYFPDATTSQRLSTSAYEGSVNDYGDIIRATLLSGNAGEVNELAFYTDYDNDASQWLIGRPQYYSFSWTQPDSSIRVQRWQLDYLADTRLVETFTRSPHNDRYKQELIYGYDSYGNVIESEMQARDADGALQTKHHTLVTYDSGEHIFPVVVESPYGLTARYRFSPQGWLQVIEGYNGEITRLGYDGFDRLVCAEYPTGYVETVAFQVLTFGDELGDAFRGHSRLRVQIKDNTGGDTTLSYDRLGRVFHASTNGFDGMRINSRIFYNDYGLVDTIQLPRLVGSGSNPYIEYTYDILRRVTDTKDSAGATTATQYNGLEILSTDANDHTTTYTYNSLGQLVAVEDALEGVVAYQYGAFGVLKKIVDPMGGEISYGSDVYSRITSSRYPSASRSSKYRYDGFDNLVWMENASGKESTFEYDLLNRLEKVTDVDITTEYNYDDSTDNALGRLYRVTVSGAWDNEERYTYNEQGLLSRAETQIDGEDFVHRYEYDDYGRLSTHHYPDGPDYIIYRGGMAFMGRKTFALRYHYNAEGYLASTSNSSGSIVYWTANEMDAAGRVTRETYGNRIETQKSFNPLTGNLESVTSAVQDLVFQYDPNGNLMTREDILGRMSETLVYDELDRLSAGTIAISGARTTIEYDYDAVGNLLFRSDVGEYIYDVTSDQPYALRRIETTDGGVAEYSYDSEGNRTHSPSHTVEYTAFNKPKEVTALSSGADIFYEYDGELNRMVERHSEGTTIYVDSFTRHTDARGNKTYQYHIGNAVVTVRTVPPKFGGVEETVLYRHFDHLGSVHKLTDDTGSERDTLYFDAFGQNRADSWLGHIRPVSDAGILYGFTGHEHDQDFDLNLINMGGRIYDPQIGQFSSPDPIIQTLTFSQNYGPYNYAFNNPLTFIDPTGYEVGGGGDPSGGGWEPSVWVTMNFSSSRTREAFHPAPAPQWDATIDTFALLSRTGGPELVSAQSGSASPVAPPDNFESLFTPRPFTETGFAGSPSRMVRIPPERQEEGLLDISILALTQGMLPVATSAASTAWRWLGGRLSSAWSSFIVRTPLRGYSNRYWANLADDLAIYESEGTHQIVVGASSELQLTTARALGSAAPQELLAADLSSASKVTVVAHAPGNVGYIRGIEHQFPSIPGRINVGGRAYTGRQLANILRQRGFRGSQIDLYVCGAASTGLQQELALSMRGVAVRAPYGIVRLREYLGAPLRVGVQWSTAKTGPVVLDESMWSVIRY